MEDNRMDETPKTADTAEAEVGNTAAELGKFKDVATLMQAYRALEAEFTRRSQRLKELEASKEQEAPAVAENASAPSSEANCGAPEGRAPLKQEEKNAVIEEYLENIFKSRGVPFVTGGGAVAAARRTPTTLKEAGALAGKLFDSKEDK
ncbi:MAG: hypothetical protein HFJ81_03210 [Clostridia bacterium]|nr:hypothetical protein [Clostridia bacterium]